MDPVIQVTYQTIPDKPDTKALHPILAAVKRAFEAIALFFVRLADGLYNAKQLSRFTDKLAAGKSITTYNDARTGIYHMFENYNENDPEQPHYKVWQNFSKDLNRSYVRAESQEGNSEHLDAFMNSLAQIAGSKIGVHMITRILHQGLIADVTKQTGVNFTSKDIYPKQSDYNGYKHIFKVKKIGDNIYFLAGSVWNYGKINNGPFETLKYYSFNIQKVIVPASKIANIQSPLDFKTEEFYSPLIEKEEDAIRQFYEAIDYTPPNDNID